MLVVKRSAEIIHTQFKCLWAHCVSLRLCLSGACLQVCAVEGGGSVALRPQHEGGQDVAGCEERQLHQSACRRVMMAAVAGVHGQVPAHWWGRT